MSDVLTTDVSLVCPHQGPITVTANLALTVGGTSVFGRTETMAATVKCPAGQSKCNAVASVASGLSQALTVAGNPIALSSLAAQTDKGKISINPPSPPSALTSS